MLDVSLTPFRGEVGLAYDAAFLYLSVRGAVAERWGHEPGFGRHAIGPDNLRLTNRAGSQIADVNLKNSRYLASGLNLDWNGFVANASEFLSDCLKAVQPTRVSRVYADVRFYSPAGSFGVARDSIASALLEGHFKHPPKKLAVFEDLSISLVFKQNLLRIDTALGPMRRNELTPHIGGEPDLGGYPETLLFVHRRYEIRAGDDLEKDRFDQAGAGNQLKSLVESQLAEAPGEVSDYICTLLK